MSETRRWTAEELTESARRFGDERFCNSFDPTTAAMLRQAARDARVLAEFEAWLAEEMKSRPARQKFEPADIGYAALLLVTHKLSALRAASDAEVPNR